MGSVLLFYRGAFAIVCAATAAVPPKSETTATVEVIMVVMCEFFSP